MKHLVSKFSFTVPEDAVKPDGTPHEDAGKKIEKAFEYKECETDEEAIAVMTDKKWSLREFVNESLKSNARSNAYQVALLPYRPTEVSADDIKERMIRDFIRMGKSESESRALVEAALANL